MTGINKKYNTVLDKILMNYIILWLFVIGRGGTVWERYVTRSLLYHYYCYTII